MRALAIQCADALGLATDVEGVGRVDLHPISELEGLDARFELRVLLAFFQVSLIEFLQQFELLLLFPD